MLVALGLVGLGFTAWLLWYSREPRYQGKPLSEWLAQIQQSDDRDARPAIAALRSMGDRAIPYLLDGIRAEDDPTKQKVAAWLNEYFDWKIQLSDAALLQERAFMGFFLLGELGEPAIPALAQALTNQNTKSARASAQALWAIGTSNCAPVLLHGLTNSNPAVQSETEDVLGRLGPEASAVGPVLVSLLDDSVPSIRAFAATAVFAVGTDARQAVPALGRKLNDADTEVRASAARALGMYATEAAGFTQALHELQTDADKKVRRAATDALLRLQCETREGAIIRGPTAERRLALAFTGHEFAEGGETILRELARHHAKASFFLTGDFLANTNHADLLRRMADQKHFLGPHSDRHLLYCDWGDRNKTLVSRAEFWMDLVANFRKLERIRPTGGIWPGYFLPPYEHYNRRIAHWSWSLGPTVINYTPGTRSNADYTGEADKNFVSSQAIFDSIVKKEREDPHGLNGFILLLHLGSGPGRTDKFHHRFGELLDYVAGKGYEFVRVDELLEPKSEDETATTK